ncbi:MAG TPA: DUF805 domain-containing protein [Desulfobulbaceae bacterium]|nr:DUF805 domain-containing protein [Desulfobulbaceae bacterium]
MNWYLAVLKNYAGFKGRAHRTEFWMFTLVNSLIMLVLGIGIVIGIVQRQRWGEWLLILLSLYSFAVLIPSYAVTVRRLHDTGRNGWLVLIIFICAIGSSVFSFLSIGHSGYQAPGIFFNLANIACGIYFFVVACFDSQPGSNQYGPNPKEIASEKISDSSI